MSVPAMEIPADKIPEFLQRLAHMPKDWIGGEVYDKYLWMEYSGQASRDYTTSDYLPATDDMYAVCQGLAKIDAEGESYYSYSEANEVFHAMLACIYAEAWGLDIDFS